MLYFEKPGKENTEKTVAHAIKAAKEQGIEKIIVASHTGETAKLFKDCGLSVIVVTHQAGYKERGILELNEETRAELTAAGMQILTTTHFFAGADRALNFKFEGIYPAELMAHTLRILGQGFKVCMEIAVMAMDAGLIGFEEDVITVGGKAKGADTAVLLTPAHSQYFFDTDVKEILCMPRGHKNKHKTQ